MSSASRSPQSFDTTPGGGSGALLSVSGVGFDYEDSPILEDVSFDVSPGEFVALVGPSGCGKSTLLNLISGVLRQRSGTIAVGEWESSSDRLGNVAYMQQKDLLLPWRSVRENSRLGLELNGVGAADAEGQVVQLANTFGIADVLDQMPWQLSGGMRQRVALLRAVLPDNDVLLLDEPFGALDAITRRSLQRWLMDALDTSDKAVVLVTHDVEEALLLSDRVLVMAPNPGRIVSEINVDYGDERRVESVVENSRFIWLKSTILNQLQGLESRV